MRTASKPTSQPRTPNSASATETRRHRPGAIAKQTESKEELEAKGSSDHAKGGKNHTRGVPARER